MPLRIDVPENFLNLFHKIFENEPVENGNKLNLFSLKISNNTFSYATLVEELGDILTTYALSRSIYDDLCSQKKYTTLVFKAKERLRKAESNDGELGEILLYTMLEAHLKAPKLLTNFGITFLVPYNKDFGRITRFLGNDLATVLFAAFCYELRSNNSL